MRIPIYVLLSASLFGCTTNYYHFDDLTKSDEAESDIYIESTGLSELTEIKEEWIIAWVVEPMDGYVEGFVNTDSAENYKCYLDYEYVKDGIYMIQSGCDPSPLYLSEDISFYYQKLKPHRNYNEWCNTMDGIGGIIDIFSEGERISIGWDNIDQCNDATSKEIYEHLKKLLVEQQI